MVSGLPDFACAICLSAWSGCDRGGAWTVFGDFMPIADLQNVKRKAWSEALVGLSLIWIRQNVMGLDPLSASTARDSA
jgi:hypothetical protein